MTDWDWTKRCKHCESNYPVEEGGCDMERPCREVLNDLLQDIRTDYVYSHWPNQRGYAYQADLISIDTGHHVMEEILKQTIDVREGAGGHPELTLKDGRVISVIDTEDWPFPTEDE